MAGTVYKEPTKKTKQLLKQYIAMLRTKRLYPRSLYEGKGWVYTALSIPGEIVPGQDELYAQAIREQRTWQAILEEKAPELLDPSILY